MRLLFFIFGLLIFVSCRQSTVQRETNTPQKINKSHAVSNMPETFDNYGGVTFVTIGPRGGGYVNPAGNNIGYRIFRVQIINDSIVPIDFDINFSKDSVTLLPKSHGFVKVFLFPRSMTPDKQDEFDFGITGLKPFLDSVSNKPTSLKMTIQSKKEYVFYIGVLLYQTDGVVRAKFSANEKNLLITVNIIDSSTFSATINCGQLSRNNRKQN